MFLLLPTLPESLLLLLDIESRLVVSHSHDFFVRLHLLLQFLDHEVVLTRLVDPSQVGLGEGRDLEPWLFDKFDSS